MYALQRDHTNYSSSRTCFPTPFFESSDFIFAKLRWNVESYCTFRLHFKIQIEYMFPAFPWKACLYLWPIFFLNGLLESLRKYCKRNVFLFSPEMFEPRVPRLCLWSRRCFHDWEEDAFCTFSPNVNLFIKHKRLVTKYFFSLRLLYKVY